jgi:hypothetical protein
MAVHLVWREDREGDALGRHRIQRVFVGGTLGQPHALRRSAEAALEVTNAPAELRAPFARRGERQDDVMIRRRDGIAVAPAPDAGGVARLHGGQRLRGLVIEPLAERGADVERAPRIEVHHPGNAGARIRIATRRARIAQVRLGSGQPRVALPIDARVPVVVRRCRGLRPHYLQPRVLARRLIEMLMNDEGVHADGVGQPRWRAMSMAR